MPSAPTPIRVSACCNSAGFIDRVDVHLAFEINDFDRNRPVTDLIIVQRNARQRTVGFTDAPGSAGPDLIERVVRFVGNGHLFRQDVTCQFHARPAQPEQLLIVVGILRQFGFHLHGRREDGRHDRQHKNGNHHNDERNSARLGSGREFSSSRSYPVETGPAAGLRLRRPTGTMTDGMATMRVTASVGPVSPKLFKLISTERRG